MKGREGFTAIVDAMIFVTVIALAFSVISGMFESREVNDVQEAPDILSVLLEYELYTDLGDGPVEVKVYEGLVYSMYRYCGALEHVADILDSHFMREGAYLLTVEHNGNYYTLGSGSGIPSSSHSQRIVHEFFTADYTLEIF